MDFKDWFAFDGGISKEEYGKRALISILGCVFLGWIPLLGWVLALALFLALIAATVRRLGDTGRSPIWTLLLLVPIVGLAFVIWLALQD